MLSGRSIVLYTIIAVGLGAAMLGIAGEPARGLTEGNTESRVQVVIYEDLECPDCALFQAMMDSQLLVKYRDRVVFIHHDFPLVWHSWARKAAIASRFFAEETADLALSYRRETMAAAPTITESNFNDYLIAFARKHKVNAEKAIRALNDPRYVSLVQKDYRDGVLRGVQHTPTVFVGERRFVERVSYETLSRAIDEAISKTK
jgi:protein-disulfide isomerase